MQTVLYLSKFDITWEFVQGKKNIIGDLLERIVERSTYRHNGPVLEEDDSHLGAIQLPHGKVLLEKPVVKKRHINKHINKVVVDPVSRDTEISSKLSEESPEPSDLAS
jgi:hypothetical protein